MENSWLNQIKRVQALACTGLVYSRDQYDQERFDEIQAIANNMLAQLSTAPLEQIVKLMPDMQNYPTPKVDVRAAVIEDNRILLVREKNNGLWTLPGGFAEIGLSPSENVVKEVSEEACITVTAQALYSVRHKSKGPFLPDVRDFYKLYFLCSRTDTSQPEAGPDVSEVRFFGIEALPELCTDRVVAEDIERAFSFMANPKRLAWFD
ncbi:NUDIX hydrolase [Pseudomonas sp. xss_1]|uniref:NUDIX hydrolase n=1 Tax=Pseudomonas sp. xss_1 TaxID=3367214 RepID=UPI00370CC4BE